MMDKTKYNRVAADASQLQMFADEVCDKIGEGGGGAVSVFEFTVNIDEEHQEILTPEQVTDIWAKKYDVIKAHLIMPQDVEEEEEEEEPTVVTLNLFFVKTQNVDDNVLSYMCGADNDGAIVSLVFQIDHDEVVYEIKDYELGGDTPGEEISCSQLFVSTSATLTGSVFVSGEFSQSDGNVSFSLGNHQIGFTVNNQEEGIVATQTVTGTIDCQNAHIISSNYDYLEDQSNEDITNTIHFYNDQTIGNVYETESHNIARSASLSYGINSHQAICQMEITEGGLSSRAVVNQYGLCIDRFDQSDSSVKPQIKFGDNTILDENEVIQLKNGLNVTYINGGSGDGTSTTFQIIDMNHINNGHYFIRTVSNGHEANVDIILTNASADKTYYGYGVIVTDVNGTTSHGVFSLCWDSNNSQYIITIPVAISSDVAWELQYKPF